MNTMLPLRWVAIGSNVLFVLFGYFAGIYPVMILHVVLFPVNVVRLLQIYRLVRGSLDTRGSTLSFQDLIPFMTRRATLVNKGDMADRLFYLQKGTAEIMELNKILGS